MALCALIDAGLPLADLKTALGSLALGDAHVHAHRVLRAGVSATKFSVHEHAKGFAEHVHTEHVHDHAEHVHDGSQHVAGSHEHVGAHHHAHRSLHEIFHL